MRAQSRTIDFATSNLRGSPVPLYLAGARIRASHALGPRAGAALNVTMLSYGDSMDLGLNVDPAAITEPIRFMAHLDRAFSDLLAGA
jgi:diacylglycerol O-acyltransferase / wax synthase